MSSKAAAGGLAVWHETRIVGEIESPGGAASLRFTYHPEWLSRRGAFPVSLALPLREDPFGPNAVGPWIRNLLPYGARRTAAAAAWGVQPEDDVALLAAMGGDAPGALTFGSSPRAPDQPRSPDQAAVADPADLIAALDRLEDSACLSEADDRAPVTALEEEGGAGPRLSPPRDGGLSTHILHREASRADDPIENRAYHLTLARMLGLPAAACRPGGYEEGGARRRYLLVARDDRERGEAGWGRLHREDLAQALGVEPDRRFARRAQDPASLDAMTALARRALPPKEFLKFLNAIMFNALIGNGQAHAKRYAILLRPQRAAAMLTDVVAPGPQPQGDWTFAQRVGGAVRRSERLQARHWRAFAAEAGLNGTFFIDRMRAMAKATLAGAAARAAERLAADPIYEAAVIGLYQRGVEERARAFLAKDRF